MASEAPDGPLVDLEAFQADRGYPVEDDEAYSGLAAELREAVDGEVRFDEYAQVLYATDGSIYQARPAGVVIPRTVEAVQAAVRVATAHEVPVLPRGAGSSLAGQAVGPGCVVIDCSKYLDEIVDIDTEARRATVQPGVVQDDLDAALAPHGLQFAPDPASSNRATIGGGIGNNSTGAHSVRYGITDAYAAELDVVLADGSLITTREVVLDGPEWEAIVDGEGREAELYPAVRGIVEDAADEIEARYPDLKRNVSGYNLDRVIYENDDGERCLNLSKLIVGSEGTLGVVVGATVDLVTKPERTALAVYCYDDLIEALVAVPVALEHDVSAVELMDEAVFDLARASEGYARYAERIPEGTRAALMVEFDSELHDDFAAAIAATDAALLDDGAAVRSIEATDAADQRDFWQLRKAAIPLLMSLEGDPKPYPFIEDATVPPAELARYVEAFEAILERHGTEAAYFAHAGAGTLHIRPILNLKETDGIETMHAIADDVTDLVLEHHGSFSGEHGDGMARTEFNPKMYGPDLWAAFKAVKTAFDPEWFLHPGNVVYRDGPDDVGPDADRGVGADMRERLRYGPTYQTLEPQTALGFDDDGGFAHLVELCNGCGTCRQTGSATMCPTYRASRDEVETTRGRANLLRAAISGELPPESLYTDRFQSEVLDLCIGCKGCKNDCPTGVDLAKLKAEVRHHYIERNGTTPRERLFANVDRYAEIGSRLAPVTNWLPGLPGSRWLLDRLLGLAPDRELPRFRRRSFEAWFADRGARIAPADADHRVVFYPDTYTNYSDPGPAEAAVRVLEAAGVHVAVPDDLEPSGRSAFSKGFVDLARDRARHNVEVLGEYVADGWSVVAVEPSDVAMFHDEYADLLGAETAATVGAATYGVFEFLDVHGLDERLELGPVDDVLTYHGHCNAKALNEAGHVAVVLDRLGFDVDVLDSGCCGMAGSFGYESEHYDLSMAIGRRLFEQVDASRGREVVAPGASCRVQLAGHLGSAPPHPIEVVGDALRE